MWLINQKKNHYSFRICFSLSSRLFQVTVLLKAKLRYTQTRGAERLMTGLLSKQQTPVAIFDFKLLRYITLCDVRPHLQFIHNEPLVFLMLYIGTKSSVQKDRCGAVTQSKSLMSLGIKSQLGGELCNLVK